MLSALNSKIAFTTVTSVMEHPCMYQMKHLLKLLLRHIDQQVKIIGSRVQM